MGGGFERTPEPPLDPPLVFWSFAFKSEVSDIFPFDIFDILNSLHAG